MTDWLPVTELVDGSAGPGIKAPSTAMQITRRTNPFQSVQNVRAADACDNLTERTHKPACSEPPSALPIFRIMSRITFSTLGAE
jgi:hypothetical protein